MWRRQENFDYGCSSGRAAPRGVLLEAGEGQPHIYPQTGCSHYCNDQKLSDSSLRLRVQAES